MVTWRRCDSVGEGQSSVQTSLGPSEGKVPTEAEGKECSAPTLLPSGFFSGHETRRYETQQALLNVSISLELAALAFEHEPLGHYELMSPSVRPRFPAPSCFHVTLISLVVCVADLVPVQLFGFAGPDEARQTHRNVAVNLAEMSACRRPSLPELRGVIAVALSEDALVDFSVLSKRI